LLIVFGKSLWLGFGLLVLRISAEKRFNRCSVRGQRAFL
jgi:hypothetical protein